MEATVDGTSLQQLEKYRVLSPIFNMVIQDDNPLGAPSGPTKMVSDGYYVFLEPLPAGNHDLHFVGTTLDNPTTGTASFGVDVKYHLTSKFNIPSIEPIYQVPPMFDFSLFQIKSNLD